jgi:hypothetical protein
MKPFYESGLVPQLARDIVDSFPGQAPVKVYAFGTTVGRVASVDAIASLPFGKDTYLDRAVTRPIEDGDSVVWIVTDNIEDRPEDGSAGNTEAFYSILRGNSVRKVVVCPFNLSKGTAGIAVYALLLSGEADGVFEKELQKFLAVPHGERQVEALRMKPLDKDTVSVVLRNPEGADKESEFQEGAIVRQKVLLTFQSRFQHLRIVDSEVRAAPAEASFHADSLFAPERRFADIRPNRVTSLEPGGATAETYEVTIALGPIRLKPGLATLVKAALRGKAEEIELQVPLEIEVPASHFLFRETFLQTYDAATMDDAKASGRIYGLEKLPILLSNSSTRIAVEAPFRFRVLYPRRAAATVLALGLLALVLLAAIIWGAVAAFRRLPKRVQWDVRVSTEYNRPVESVLDKRGELSVADSPLAIIRGSNFTPVDGAVLIDPPGDSAGISEDAPVKVQRGGDTLVVTFKKKAAKTGAKPGSGEVEVTEE